MSNVIEQFKKELDNLKAQREEYLLEYGDKVRVLDKKRKELVTEQKALEAEIKVLKNNKEEIAKEAFAEAKDLTEEVKAKLADAEAKLSIVKKAEEELFSKTSKAAKKIEERLNEANTEINKARENSAESSAVLKENIDKQSELDTLIKDNHTKSMELEALIVKNNKKAKSLADKEKDLISLQGNLEKELQKIPALKKDLEQKIQYQRDLIDKTEKESMKLSEQRIALDGLISDAQAEKAKSEQILKEQARQNKFRSRELDVGFDMLEREQKALKQEQKRIDKMKDEMSKKGA